MKKTKETCELCFTEASKLTKATVRVFKKDGWQEEIVSACNTCMENEDLGK